MGLVGHPNTKCFSDKIFVNLFSLLRRLLMKSKDQCVGHEMVVLLFGQTCLLPHSTQIICVSLASFGFGRT